ncbi:MAG TPA: DUF3570 domain-containing protein [Chitinophagales bacterium]|nr:DUF3570 domain-containing protein [Chitinophagales bacterium]
MRKIPLIIIALCASILGSFAQVTAQVDSADYKERKLKIDEINFVSGYYLQDGNHSAVTGGIGTEKLTDLAGSIELKLSRLTSKGNKNSLSFDIGVDTYTSASSDNISPLTGPSRQDTRIYPALTLGTENIKKGITLRAGVSYSREYDYHSRGLNLSFIKSSKDNNREFGVTLFAYFDLWTVIYPYELRPPGYGTAGEDDPLPVDILPRNSYQASFTLSQVINERLQVALLFDPAYQQGQLTTLYQRVYFNDSSERVEKLPDTRFKIPVAVRINYFAGDRFIIRAYYRFYYDDWGNIAHTTDVEIPVKLSPFFSISPFYRFSVQSGIDYFAPYKGHNTKDEFYTSDYDLSPFNSHYIGLGIRAAPPNGVLGLKHWSSVELRYGHYKRSTDLVGNSFTLALKFK